MSNLLSQLQKAIDNADKNTMINIMKSCILCPLEPEVADFYRELKSAWANIENSLSSSLPQDDINYFILLKNTFLIAHTTALTTQATALTVETYQQRFQIILTVRRLNHVQKFTAITHDLIALNQQFLTTPVILLKALTEGFTQALNLPINNRIDYYKNLITLAYNLFQINPISPTTQNTPLNMFDLILNNFRLNLFSIDDLAEILSIQPVQHLTAIFNLYVELKSMISKEEFQRLIVKVKWQDWPHLYKSPFSQDERNILVYHLRNHAMDSLISRAYTILYKHGDDSFEKAQQDPFAIIHKYEPVIQISSQSLPGIRPSSMNQTFFHASELANSGHISHQGKMEKPQGLRKQ